MRSDGGRGALSTPQSRFHSVQRIPLTDAYADKKEDCDLAPKGTRTTVISENAKSILSHNRSPDVPFNTSLNAYRGCEHGCIYCYARPSHAYVDLSPGRDFESIIFAKRNAARLLRKEFQKPGHNVETIVMGANTDPYQPIEKEEGITRSLLELCLEYRHPVAITTKNHLILRDLDLLSELAALELVSVNLSITGLEADLSSRMEPRASSPQRRLEALAALRANQIPAGVLMAPIIPGLNDVSIESVVAACAGARAQWLFHILLRMPYEIKDLFSEWLDHHFPEKKDRILHLIQSTRGGKMNDPRFGHRMSGKGNYASLIHMRVRSSVIRHGIPQLSARLRKDLFLRAPHGQPDLFGAGDAPG